MKANDFLSTLGADTHLIQGLETPAAMSPGLKYTGVRNIRDDAIRDTSKIAKLCVIHRATGAMVDELPIVDSDPNNNRLYPSRVRAAGCLWTDGGGGGIQRAK